MSSSNLTAIELDRLPAPQVVESLNYEAIFNDMLLNFYNLYPQFDAIVEADPVYKLLEVVAYRELYLRQRVNDAARDVMLAFAQGSDLDQLGANYGVSRELVRPASDDPVNPTPAIYEDDARLKLRVQLSVEALTTAGSIGSYKFHGLSASPDVKDIGINSPSPGVVEVFILSVHGDGEPDDALVGLVDAALNDEQVRPLTDQVLVKKPDITFYTLNADLWFYPGPDPVVVMSLAEAAAQAYVDANHLLGHDITMSGIYAALHQEGVQRVELLSLSDSLVLDVNQVAFCSQITLNNKGTDV